MNATSLTYERLRSAVEGNAAAFRVVTDLDPAGGDGDKLFPPTYEGGVYSRETRVIGGEPRPCVLLDSVQSQANRLELALLAWHRESGPEGKPFPLVEIDFSGTEAGEVGRFSALEAPHRIADAAFLASEIEDEPGSGRWLPFRHPKNPTKGSRIGRLVDEASARNATGLFGLCPTALIFGMWDSHGARGGLGEKFQRALVSEVFGVGATDDNRRPASRVDPLIVVAGQSLPITVADDRTWTVAEKGKGKTKLSEVGLGNVTPSLKDKKTNDWNPGGVTVQFARQIAILSLPALRRLRFPVERPSGDVEPRADIEARTALAALALAALQRQWEVGFSLRSRCDLIPRGEFVVSLLFPGREEPFGLTSEGAVELAARASREARAAGLPWPTDRDAPPWKAGCLTLRPGAEFVKAVAQSRRLATEARD